MAAANLKLFVLDDGASRGPLPLAKIRRGIASSEIPSGARFRVAEDHPWLPGASWEALADLLPAPPAPTAPKGPGETSLPAEIAKIPAQVREILLWFVGDGDGVMGPVSGDFVMMGIKNGKIPLTAVVSLATWQVGAPWVRAPLVFPGANVGATTIRKQPLPTRACVYCREPVAPGDAECLACGEPARSPTGPGAVARALAVIGAFATAAAIAFGAAAIARGRLRGGAGTAAPPSKDPVLPAPAESAAAGARPALADPAVARARGHLVAGEIGARLDAGSDAADALALSDHRIAIARGAALDVIDDRNGALVFAAADLAGARALYPVHAGPGAAYALIGERLAALDARTARVAAWIDAGEAPPPGVPAALDRGLALLADPARQAVTVLDAARHVALARSAFEEPIALLAIADSGRIALAVAGSAKPARPGAPPVTATGPVYAFAPDLAAGAQPTALDAPPPSGRTIAPLRRIDLGDAPAAVAVAPDGSFGVAVLRGRAELVRIDLAPSAALSPPGPRSKTCAEPADVAIAAGVIVVACQGGRTASLHDGATLAALASIDLGGPSIGLDVAPDRAQALVTVGAPAPGVAVIDLRKREGRKLAAGEPITPARYGLGGRVATALAPQSHRLLVLR